MYLYNDYISIFSRFCEDAVFQTNQSPGGYPRHNASGGFSIKKCRNLAYSDLQTSDEYFPETPIHDELNLPVNTLAARQLKRARVLFDPRIELTDEELKVN